MTHGVDDWEADSEPDGECVDVAQPLTDAEALMDEVEHCVADTEGETLAEGLFDGVAVAEAHTVGLREPLCVAVEHGDADADKDADGEMVALCDGVCETEADWLPLSVLEAQPEADCECDDETLGEADSEPLTDAQADELKDADRVEDAQPDTVGDDDTDAVALRVPEEQGLGDCEVVLHCDALRV